MDFIICDEKLREELSDFYSYIDESVIQKLKQLCIVYNMTEEVMASQLLAYVTKCNDRESLSVEFVQQFETDFLNRNAINAQRSSATKRVSTLKTVSSNKDQIMALKMQFLNECSEPKLTTRIEIAVDCDDMNDSTVHKTPEKMIINKVESNSMEVSCMTTPIARFDDSIDTSIKVNICSENENLNVLFYFGNSQNENDWKIGCKTKLNIDYYDKALVMSEPYKFMAFKLFESNEIMSDIIDEFSDLYRNKYDIDCWAQFSVDSAAEAFYIGRVKYDWDKNKLDETSILLEGSDYITDSENIRLDLSMLSEYSLFPGQIIACKAMNERIPNEMKKLIVREILSTEKIICWPKEAPTLTAPLNIVVAVGPFTLPSTLNYQPLKDILKYAKEYEPDFLILIGPFVDLENEKLLSINQSIESYLQTQMRLIHDELKYTNTSAIIIPSVRDINTFNTLPTMPLNIYKSEKINYYPNPVVLNINGVAIGITSTDILKHLSKEEIYLNTDSQNADRLSRISNHIIRQRNFYPLYPPNDEINLEVTKYDFLQLPVTPHILILPSDLKQFVKNISRSVVVNCGRISKSNFARIKVDPINNSDYNGSLEGYTNVEIVKMKSEM